MGGRWTLLLVLAVAAVPARCFIFGSLEYNITSTWNGGEIDHPPVQLALSGSDDGQYLELSIEAPFYDDPGAPDGPPGKPFFGLWEYEVVKAFFLNDANQYVEIEICPYGQHIVLLLNGRRVTIRHSLPLEVNTTISEDTWTGFAKIPVGYLPENVTKFNAYSIYGSDKNRNYESLYPASQDAVSSDSHALQYFGAIDLSEILPDHQSTEMSELWRDSIDGIFRYRINTLWNSVPVNNTPAEITLQGFTGGVEMNVTATLFNDTAPDGPKGVFYGLWDEEIVEMLFLNDKDEYLQVELGPWGHHFLLFLVGARNVVKHSLPLDYIITERTDPSGEDAGQWKGSAMIPPEYFPARVNRMNAYAIHGTGLERQYEALYPAPYDDPGYVTPDFHRLELFHPIDFEFLVTNNTHNSETWQNAIESVTSATTSVVEAAEEMEAVTLLGPAEATATSAPVQSSHFLETQDSLVQPNLGVETVRKPNPQRVFPDVLHGERYEEKETRFSKPLVSDQNAVPKPQPVRIGNREIENSHDKRPLRQPTKARIDFENQGLPPPSQFQEGRISQGNTPFQDPRPDNRRQGQFEGPPTIFDGGLPQGAPQFATQGQSQGAPQFATQSQSQLPGTSQLQSPKRPVIPIQDEPSFQDPRQPPFQEQNQFSDQNIRQSQRPSLFETLEHQFQEQQSQFQNQGQPPFQNQGQPPFQNQGQLPFQNQGQSFQNQGQPPFQNQGQPPFQNQGQPLFQNQGQSLLQNQEQPPFQTQRQNHDQTPFQNQETTSFQNPGQSLIQNQEQVQPPTQGRPLLQNEQPSLVDETQTQFHGQGPPRFHEQGRPPIQSPQGSLSENPNGQTGFQQGQSFDVPGSETSIINPSQDTGVEGNLTPEVEKAVITLTNGSPALPPPHPVCFEIGLVPDPDRCYVFHECVLEAGEWQLYSWRCRRGQVYDPVNVACKRGRCARRSTRRRRVRHQ